MAACSTQAGVRGIGGDAAAAGGMPTATTRGAQENSLGVTGGARRAPAAAAACGITGARSASSAAALERTWRRNRCNGVMAGIGTQRRELIGELAAARRRKASAKIERRVFCVGETRRGREGIRHEAGIFGENGIGSGVHRQSGCIL